MGLRMNQRHCTCGAEADVRRTTRRTADGREEIIYRVACPVCGQLGPAVPLGEMSEEAAIAAAILAWNEMYVQLRS